MMTPKPKFRICPRLTGTGTGTGQTDSFSYHFDYRQTIPFIPLDGYRLVIAITLGVIFVIQVRRQSRISSEASHTSSVREASMSGFFEPYLPNVLLYISNANTRSLNGSNEPNCIEAIGYAIFTDAPAGSRKWHVG